ncbi:MAG: hypothetical protein IK134_06305 [Oscillospiraceae bacterium]|nr:hypothetical protein [Oscillospiraceae bacterium]
MNCILRRISALLTAVLLFFLMMTEPAADTAPPAASAAAEILGIDISKYQEEIDWETLAASDVKFVILRCCKVIRAYNDWEVDATFETNYAAAKAAGIAVGCYMFTDAASTEEFEEDVSYMLSFLQDKSFEFPVFLDMESASRQEHLSPSVFMPALLTGLEMIEDAGHTAGVYSSSAFFNECIDRKQIQEAGYPIWEANYFNTINGLTSPAGHDLSGEATIWQYSGCGRAPGIRTTVDCNICYTYSYFNHAATIVNSVLPSGSLRNGSNFTIAGTINSESVIRTITGAIYDINKPGEPVQTVTVYPHAREYKLTGFFTKKLIFSTLPDGDYELRITAVDASDTPIDITESQFSISKDGDIPQQVPEDSGGAEGNRRADESWSNYTGPLSTHGQFHTRFSIWTLKHLSMRTVSGTATRIGLKLQLERTPLYRIVSKTFLSLETGYLAAKLRLEVEKARAAALS